MTPEQMKSAAYDSEIQIQKAAMELGRRTAIREIEEAKQQELYEASKKFLVPYSKKEGESEYDWDERMKAVFKLRNIDATLEEMASDHVRIVRNGMAVDNHSQRLKKVLHDKTEELQDKTDELLEESQLYAEEQTQHTALQVRVVNLRAKCKNRNTSLQILGYTVPILVLFLVSICNTRPELIYQYLPTNYTGAMGSDLLLAAISTAWTLLVPLALGRFMDPGTASRQRGGALPQPGRRVPADDVPTLTPDTRKEIAFVKALARKNFRLFQHLPKDTPHEQLDELIARSSAWTSGWAKGFGTSAEDASRVDRCLRENYRCFPRGSYSAQLKARAHRGRELRTVTSARAEVAHCNYVRQSKPGPKSTTTKSTTTKSTTLKTTTAKNTTAKSTPVFPYVGKHVIVSGLLSRPGLNGSKGFAVSFDPFSSATSDTTGRYNVQIENGETIALRPRNLSEVSESNATPLGPQSNVHGAPCTSAASNATKLAGRSTISAATSNATPSMYTKERHAEFVFRINHFYQRHSPDRLKDLEFAEVIARRYAGREQELFDSLSKKYGDLRA
jgi:hypothetical protein